jgi:hypothetical protein
MLTIVSSGLEPFLDAFPKHGLQQATFWIESTLKALEPIPLDNQ